MTAAPIPLLQRAGFEIDLICPGRVDFDTQVISLIAPIGDSLVQTAAHQVQMQHYDVVILGGDDCIAEILDSDLADEIKLKLLPVQHTENFTHLYSKCGLSNILQASIVLTPVFAICNRPDELITAADQVGYPLFIKVDRSGGGDDVYECQSAQELIHKAVNLPYPLLLQKKIAGKTVDLTSFYQHGKLVSFSYALFHKSIRGKFGPSSVRRYTQIGALRAPIYQELNALGHILGANGFANVTCIECASTGKRYYIEADMRPNVWVDYGKYVGNDAAAYFKNYFEAGKVMSKPPKVNSLFPISRLVPFVARLSIGEIIVNRYSAWEFFDSPQKMFEHIAGRVRAGAYAYLLKSKNRTLPYYYRAIDCIAPCLRRAAYAKLPYQMDLGLRLFCSQHLKPIVPKSLWRSCAQIYKRILLREEQQ